ncbi:hypothetical protein CBR_g29628 [Chara braunii]|uniref:Uncharacterized protein n=1 Tax=Chara braunii TaxID=69332 RepID=A0A388LBC2_CHABU|nr:hypothetical protein CBR_g29628 [Chara braunii]|eukprot:GBG79482.1 hypothetical protein CBR_g29628 [Chara braunii]
MDSRGLWANRWSGAPGRRAAAIPPSKRTSSFTSGDGGGKKRPRGVSLGLTLFTGTSPPESQWDMHRGEEGPREEVSSSWRQATSGMEFSICQGREAIRHRSQGGLELSPTSMERVLPFAPTDYPTNAATGQRLPPAARAEHIWISSSNAGGAVAGVPPNALAGTALAVGGVAAGCLGEGVDVPPSPILPTFSTDILGRGFPLTGHRQRTPVPDDAPISSLPAFSADHLQRDFSLSSQLAHPSPSAITPAFSVCSAFPTRSSDCRRNIRRGSAFHRQSQQPRPIMPSDMQPQGSWAPGQSDLHFRQPLSLLSPSHEGHRELSFGSQLSGAASAFGFLPAGERQEPQHLLQQQRNPAADFLEPREDVGESFPTTTDLSPKDWSRPWLQTGKQEFREPLMTATDDRAVSRERPFFLPLPSPMTMRAMDEVLAGAGPFAGQAARPSPSMVPVPSTSLLNRDTEAHDYRAFPNAGGPRKVFTGIPQAQITDERRWRGWAGKEIAHQGLGVGPSPTTSSPCPLPAAAGPSNLFSGISQHTDERCRGRQRGGDHDMRPHVVRPALSIQHPGTGTLVNRCPPTPCLVSKPFAPSPSAPSPSAPSPSAPSPSAPSPSALSLSHASMHRDLSNPPTFLTADRTGAKDTSLHHSVLPASGTDRLPLTTTHAFPEKSCPPPPFRQDQVIPPSPKNVCRWQWWQPALSLDHQGEAQRFTHASPLMTNLVDSPKGGMMRLAAATRGESEGGVDHPSRAADNTRETQASLPRADEGGRPVSQERRSHGQAGSGDGDRGKLLWVWDEQVGGSQAGAGDGDFAKPASREQGRGSQLAWTREGDCVKPVSERQRSGSQAGAGDRHVNRVEEESGDRRSKSTTSGGGATGGAGLKEDSRGDEQAEAKQERQGEEEEAATKQREGPGLMGSRRGEFTPLLPIASNVDRTFDFDRIGGGGQEGDGRKIGVTSAPVTGAELRKPIDACPPVDVPVKMAASGGDAYASESAGNPVSSQKTGGQKESDLEPDNGEHKERGQHTTESRSWLCSDADDSGMQRAAGGYEVSVQPVG